MNGYLHYKNYTGSIEFSEADGVFHGKVIGIQGLISFEGESASQLTEDFHAAVDEYLEFCTQQNTRPEQPFKGSFNVRIGSELHRDAALLAKAQGISLNALVEQAIALCVRKVPA